MIGGQADCKDLNACFLIDKTHMHGKLVIPGKGDLLTLALKKMKKKWIEIFFSLSQAISEMSAKTSSLITAPPWGQWLSFYVPCLRMEFWTLLPTLGIFGCIVFTAWTLFAVKNNEEETSAAWIFSFLPRCPIRCLHCKWKWIFH